MPTTTCLFAAPGPDCGIARICLDGQPAVAAEPDSYGPTVNWNAQHRLAEGLPEAEHVLRIQVTGRKHNKPSNTYVQVAGFDVS
jgi:hypothetical protein